MAERRAPYGGRDDDTAIRLAAFEFLGQQSRRYPDTIPRNVLADGFSFEGRRVPLVGPAGIFKPAVLDIPLSVTTVPVVPGRSRPYEDDVDLDGRFVVAEDRRRYVTASVRLRLHQVAFSQHVISAYREQCTVCRLKHRELLDAAHILPDGHILGIRPDLKIEIRHDVLTEEDGPMLKHGLQGFQGAAITVPRRAALQPNRGFLEERFDLFRKAN